MKALDVIRRPKRCPRCGGEICDFYAKKSSFVLLSREIALPLPQTSVADFTEKGVIEITNL